MRRGQVGRGEDPDVAAGKCFPRSTERSKRAQAAARQRKWKWVEIALPSSYLLHFSLAREDALHGFSFLKPRPVLIILAANF